MKSLFHFLLVPVLFSFTGLEDIYSISFKTIDGAKVELGNYRGRKMLFVVLPAAASDTVLSMGQLSALQSKYDTSLVVIGIPSEEAGFRKGGEDKIKKPYKDAKPGFILAEGMKVKKGGEQSTLFHWLTSKDKNRHFDQDVPGPGTKFFVDEQGKLYAVIGAQVKPDHAIIHRILTHNAIKK